MAIWLVKNAFENVINKAIGNLKKIFKEKK